MHSHAPQALHATPVNDRPHMSPHQMLARLESLSHCGLVHGDVQPANFLMGKDDATHKRTVHLIDFGLSSKFMVPSDAAARGGNGDGGLNGGRSNVDGRQASMLQTALQASSPDHNGSHASTSYAAASPAAAAATPLGRSRGKVSGTLEFSSSRVLQGLTAQPRDDLESLAYCLAYLLHGHLPWSEMCGYPIHTSSTLSSSSGVPPLGRPPWSNLDRTAALDTLDVIEMTAEAAAEAKEACFAGSRGLFTSGAGTGGGTGPHGPPSGSHMAVAEDFVHRVLAHARGLAGNGGRGTAMAEAAAEATWGTCGGGRGNAATAAVAALPDYAALRREAADALALMGVAEGADVIFDWEVEGVTWSTVDGSLALEGYRQ